MGKRTRTRMRGVRDPCVLVTQQQTLANGPRFVTQTQTPTPNTLAHTNRLVHELRVHTARPHLIKCMCFFYYGKCASLCTTTWRRRARVRTSHQQLDRFHVPLRALMLCHVRRCDAAFWDAHARRTERTAGRVEDSHQRTTCCRVLLSTVK